MAVQASDIKLFQSVTVSDLPSNGGRMSTTEIVGGVKNNMFPNVTNAERTTGLHRYRKGYMKNENTAGDTYANSRLWVGRLTPAGDFVRIKEGTNTDIQSDATTYTQWRGSGTLAENITGGVDDEFDVTFDEQTGVHHGDIIHISDGVNEEFCTLDSTAGVSWSGNTATLTLAPGTTVQYSYALDDTVVGAVIELGDIVASLDNWVENNIHSGTYDESTYPPTVYNVGTVEDNWTITFTGSGTFSCSGEVTGSVGTGDTSTDFQPANGASYYFKIDKDGWSGTWTTGDSITFSTHHSAKAFWVVEKVPAAAASYTGNNPRLDHWGESS